jgi:trk system potassium uptake protein TrkA
VQEADILIAATNSDEMNMVCCLTAKKLGAKHTIARIRDPEYADELSQLKMDLDLDMVINPEQAVAGEIARLLEFPSAANIEVFAEGRVVMMEMKVTRDMPIAGMSLKEMTRRGSLPILIGGVLRGETVIIPRGDFVMREGDLLYIVGRPSKVIQFFRRAGVHVQKVKNVMVMGGGRIAYYLAKFLEEMEVGVKIIEIDEHRCIELTEMLPDALIIHGDASDESVLHSENLENMSAFISVTGRDEENLIAALLAKQYGVPKVVAKINRINFSAAIKNLGIDNLVSPKITTANYILRYVRGLQNAADNPVKTLYRIMEGRVEALEFTADRHTRFLDVPLKRLKVAPGILVAAIVRQNEIIIPYGNDVIKERDNVILIAYDTILSDLNEMVSSEE